MTSKTPGSSVVMNRISRDERTAPINTFDNGEIPQYMSLDEYGPVQIDVYMSYSWVYFW